MPHKSSSPHKTSLDPEVFRLNRAVLLNQESHSEVLRLIRKAHLETDIRCKHNWEGFMARWRGLQHNRSIDRFRHKIRSEHYTHPRQAEDALSEYRNRHDEHDKQRIDLLINLVNTSPINLSSKLVTNYQAKLMVVQELETAEVNALYEKLEQVNESLLIDLKSQTEDLRHELHSFEALCFRPDWPTLTSALEIMLRDNTLTDLFRLGGSLKSDLENTLRVLTSHGLEYSSQLLEIKEKVKRILLSLPLKEVLEACNKMDLLDRLRANCKYYDHILCDSSDSQFYSQTVEIFRSGKYSACRAVGYQ